MAKKFDSFMSFGTWLQKVNKEAKKKAIKEIAEEWYKDSEKYTYIDTKKMYLSGETNSNFDKGVIILRAPQVKWLYYTTWVRPRYNMNACPQWFEATKSENMAKYKRIYVNAFNEAKKEV